MTTENNNQNESKSNTPSHIAYHVEERGGDAKNIWTQIGALWPHQNGKGFNLKLAGYVHEVGRHILTISMLEVLTHYD